MESINFFLDDIKLEKLIIRKERSVDLENEYRKIICSSCPDLKQISINIFLKEKYSEKISFL